MNDFPVLFCLVCVASSTVEYSSTNKSAVNGFYLSMPEEVRELFSVVEYRAIINNESEE